jgi:hypothetical protein
MDNIFDAELFLNTFLEGFLSTIIQLFQPFIYWVVVPGGILWLVTGMRKEGYYVGALLGLILLFTIGPFSNT